MLQPANVAWVERHGSGMDNWMLLEALHLSGVDFGKVYGSMPDFAGFADGDATAIARACKVAMEAGLRKP